MLSFLRKVGWRFVMMGRYVVSKNVFPCRRSCVKLSSERVRMTTLVVDLQRLDRGWEERWGGRGRKGVWCKAVAVENCSEVSPAGRPGMDSAGGGALARAKMTLCVLGPSRAEQRLAV